MGNICAVQGSFSRCGWWRGEQAAIDRTAKPPEKKIIAKNERGVKVETTSDRIVAVIGAGPAGLFAAKHLAASGCQVVLFNRDIKPGGLAEYGIYVDKHRLKEGFRAQFKTILSSPSIHYLGNVMVGEAGDLTLEQIMDLGFHAILVTVGAQAEKKLNLPGENLQGVYHAKNVVYHYNLLPPYGKMPFPIGKNVKIVGAGNVMMDIAHWLIDKHQVDEMTAVVRRGPAEVKFDQKELESVVASFDINHLRAEIERVAPLMRTLGQDPEKSMASFSQAAQKACPHESHTRGYLRFLVSPHQVLGDSDGKVTGLEVEENTLVLDHGQTRAIGTGKYQTLPADTVIFAIGDQIDRNLGLPVQDNQYARNPNPSFPVEGISFEAYDPAVGQTIPGVFLAGWARQASTGMVGIAKRDGMNAVEAMRQYLDHCPANSPVDTAKLVNEIQSRCENSVTYTDIQRLEQVEQQLAQEKNLEEFKFDTNEEMLAAIQSG